MSEKRLRAYRFALDPTGTQLDAFAQHAGAARWAYNHALAVKDEAHHTRQLQLAEFVTIGWTEQQAQKLLTVKTPSKGAIQKRWNQFKDDRPEHGQRGICPWWRSVSTYAFQDAWDDADQAFKNFFRALKEDRAAGPDPDEARIREARRRRQLQLDELVTMGWTQRQANKLATVHVPHRSKKPKRDGKVGLPRNKSKGKSRDSFRLHHDVKNPTIRLDGYRRLRMPRLGSVRLHDSGKRMSRALDRGGVVQSVTVSRGGSRWYASVLVSEPDITPGRETQGGEPSGPTGPSRQQKSHGRVGVDLGVTHLAALSTGEVIDNPRHLDRAQKKLTKTQRELSRRQGPDKRTGQQPSNRWYKTRAKLSRLQHQVSEQRASHLHQITKDLSCRFAEVAIEDLNVSGMTSSAKGTVEEPGTNVKAKSGLNRQVLDVAPGEFRRQLEYKSPWYGSKVAYCDRWYPSSKTCSACGVVKAKLALSERVFTCDSCGLSLDRDVNAACNIAATAVVDSGQETLNARGDHGSPPSGGRGRRSGKAGFGPVASGE